MRIDKPVFCFQINSEIQYPSDRGRLVDPVSAWVM